MIWFLLHSDKWTVLQLAWKWLKWYHICQKFIPVTWRMLLDCWICNNITHHSINIWMVRSRRLMIELFSACSGNIPMWCKIMQEVFCYWKVYCKWKLSTRIQVINLIFRKAFQKKREWKQNREEYSKVQPVHVGE